MREISDGFIETMQDNSTLMLKATLALADGTEIDLEPEDFMAFGNKFEFHTSSESSFDIGSAVVGSASLTIENWDGRFDSLDFGGSTIVPYVGKDLDTGTEWLRMGVYSIEQPDTYSSSLSLKCYDNLVKLSLVRYSDIVATYPCTAAAALNQICQECGVLLEPDEKAPNSRIVLNQRPDGAMTCLEAAGYLAQVMGCYLVCDEWGSITMGWYDGSPFEDGIDGGSFVTDTVPYSDGDEIDGGSLDDYSSGYSYSGRDLADEGSEALELAAPYSETVLVDDVVITGVTVTAQDKPIVGEGESAQGETATAGYEGYVLSIEGNPFVEYGMAQKVANGLYGRVGGMAFRPFSRSMPCNPALEVGDPVEFADKRGVIHQSFVTGLTLAVNDAMQAKCSAKSAARNSSAAASALTRAIVLAREALRQEATARELMAARISAQIAAAPGLYQSSKERPDGSAVYYLHDAPTLENSTVIWQMTATTVTVSTDGGQTYNAALTADGTAILERIYAVGIDADYVKTGRISSADGLSYFDLDSGELVIANHIANGEIESMGSTLSDLTSRIVSGFDEDDNAYIQIYASPNGGDDQSSGAARDVSLRLTGDRVSFMDAGVEVAYITGQRFHIASGEVVSSQVVGEWKWYERENGNLTLKYIG